MIGYWVTQFTSVIYDRWYMVKIASEQDAWLVSHSVDTDWRQLVPQDTSEASNQFIKDLWNDVVIGQLMENWTSIEVVKDNPIEPFNAESFFRKPENSSLFLVTERAKFLAKNIIRILMRISTRPAKAMCLYHLGCRFGTFTYTTTTIWSHPL